MAPPKRLGSADRSVGLFPRPEDAALRTANRAVSVTGEPALDPEILRGLAENLARMGQGMSGGTSAASAARFAELPQLPTVQVVTSGASQLSLPDLIRLIQSRAGRLEHSMGNAREAKKPTPEQKAKMLLSKNLKHIVARLQSREAGYGYFQAMTGLLAAQVRDGNIYRNDFKGMDWASAPFADRLESALQVAGAARAQVRESLRVMRESGRNVEILQSALEGDDAALTKLIGQLENLRGAANDADTVETQKTALYDTLLDVKHEAAPYLLDVLTLRSEEEPEIVDEAAAHSAAQAVAQSTLLIASLVECRRMAERDVTNDTKVMVGKPKKLTGSLDVVLTALDEAAKMIERGEAVPEGHFVAALRATSAEFAYQLGVELENIAALLR